MRSMLLLVAIAACHGDDGPPDAPDGDPPLPQITPCTWGDAGSFVGPDAEPRQLLVNPDGSLAVVGSFGASAFAMIFDPAGTPGPMQTSSDAVVWDAISARPNGGYTVAGTTSDGRPILEALDASGVVDATGCRLLGSSGLRGLAVRESSAGLVLVSVGPISAETRTAEIELDRFATTCAPDGVLHTTIAADALPIPPLPPIGFVLPELDVVVASRDPSGSPVVLITTFPKASPATPTTRTIGAGNAFFLAGPVGGIGLDGVVTLGVSGVEQFQAGADKFFETAVWRSDDAGPGLVPAATSASLLADSPAIRWSIGATIETTNLPQLMASSRNDPRTILAQRPMSFDAFTAAMARSDGALFAIGRLSREMVVRCFAAP